MIVVFCEFGGEGLLGKAREIADSVGDRVLALVGESSDPNRAVYLGADEVFKVDVETPGEWIGVISELFESEKRIRFLIFPSNIVSNVIAGAVYFREMKRVGVFIDDCDYADEANASKAFDANGLAIQKGLVEDKTNILSLKARSFARPFEDTSRYGKVRDYKRKDGAPLAFLMEQVPKEPLSSSDELTFIAGNNRVVESVRKLAQKFHARLLQYSGAIEVVDGPCVAFEITEKLRHLPEFRQELISLNAETSPINAISDTAVVSVDLQQILEELAK
jgi:hypothetical protein